MEGECPPGDLGVEFLEGGDTLVIDILVASQGGESVASADSYSNHTVNLYFIR